MNILVVAGHPDDEVLGCAGTIIKHIKAGDSVTSLILGEGLTARKDFKKRELRVLWRSADKASKYMGTTLIQKSLPDNKFDSISRLEITKIIEEAIGKIKPKVNIDHRYIVEALEPAIRPMKGSSVMKVVCFETPSSTEWNFVRKLFRPNMFVDISEEWEEKRIVLNMYGQEMRDFPHPRSLKAIESLAYLRGAQSGYEMAEAFEILYIRED
jgi:LmbE family N-acetylglucosaminyl deacetylase